MNRTVILALGTALCAALVLPAALQAQTRAPAATKSAAYKAARNAFGQPDLGGAFGVRVRASTRPPTETRTTAARIPGRWRLETFMAKPCERYANAGAVPDCPISARRSRNLSINVKSSHPSGGN